LWGNRRRCRREGVAEEDEEVVVIAVYGCGMEKSRNRMYEKEEKEGGIYKYKESGERKFVKKAV
jgi:hypothetical protein